jgi:transposase-like protein
MDADIDELCQTKRGKHNAGRINSRNGYHHTVYQSCAGEIALKVPKLRSGKYIPGIFQRRQLVEQALIAVIHESYFRGMVKRSSEELTNALSIAGMSVHQALQVSMEIDERVKRVLLRHS